MTFDISKLRDDLKKVLKESKYQTLGITNFHAIPMNKIPGDDSSVSGHNVRGVYWTKPDSSGNEVDSFLSFGAFPWPATTLSGTPTADDVGVYTVRIVVTDGTDAAVQEYSLEVKQS